jgi:uncharacterized protein YbjT (DUF2867 family)
MVARHVVLAGATGLVGRALLDGLLANETVESVLVLTRRDIGRSATRLTVRRVDFTAIAPLTPVDEVYLALGTTIKVAGSQAAFRAVDFDANLAVARVARAAGATHAGLVSAMGADPKSSVFYSRVKGELEEALVGLHFEGQPTRRGEVVGEVVGRLLGPLVPRDYRPIAATAVARALLASVPRARGRVVLCSGVMDAPLAPPLDAK